MQNNRAPKPAMTGMWAWFTVVLCEMASGCSGRTATGALPPITRAHAQQFATQWQGLQNFGVPSADSVRFADTLDVPLVDMTY